MSRKRLDEERIPQILDAFERCIMKYGLAETSLERVAQEAKISRTTINHYIGGRKDLTRAAHKRFADTWLEGIGRLADLDIDDLLDYMMTGWKEEISDRLEIVSELDRAVSRDSETFTAVSEVLEYLFQSEAVHFQRLYPAASLERCREAGMMLYAIGIGVWRISGHIELPSNEVLRSSMKGILDSLLSNASD
ncbi:MAG: TetR/AcrR family transcriptional regulator [Desulfobacterales bacterium]|nr:TetR/AcrR family transcriptional regulator [Desulfobacterales bacterium]MDX2510429.1 TetR/AcrR family transcriptional regulator [Desulfobacterales bacterium]